MKIRNKANWVIKLPNKSKLFVEVGDKVKVGDKLAVFNSHKVENFDYSGNLGNISDSKREELDNLFRNKVVQEGDLFLNLGFLKNKLCFPLTGLCLGLDEFKNLKIEKTEDIKKEIFTPVEAKVTKIEEGKMVLEFDAKEYKGKGLNGLKAWGEGEIKIIDDIKFLNYQMEGNVLFTKNIERAFLLKARVVGIKAIVVLENEKNKEIEIDLPVLELDEQTWKEFTKDNLGKNKKMLVNSKMDKLILVLE
ncbi:MAG: hypothetical protein PHH12_01210 [Candidatus Shapirobacteria bacterium]|nr:hypothetical protein [Candidatus Shapirobacteria bacterium]